MYFLSSCDVKISLPSAEGFPPGLRSGGCGELASDPENNTGIRNLPEPWNIASIAQLGECQTEDLEVLSSILSGGIFCFSVTLLFMILVAAQDMNS